VKNMKKGNLVILVGIDGSGKSTLLANLENKGYFTSHWRKLKGLSLQTPLNFENPGEIVQTLKGQKRLKFIWGYVSSEYDYLIKPALSVGKSVISDGFFIRFLIKEKIYKRLPIRELLKRSPLRGDEFIIMIDVSPKIAYERKIGLEISPYECFKTPEDFVYFQSLQRKFLLDYIKEFPHLVINGELPRNKLARIVLNALKENQIYPK